jgi:hypothetical protein
MNPRKSILKILFGLIVILASEPLNAGIFLDLESLIRGEEFARDPRFAPVGAVSYLFNGVRGASASGVLITPEWVLTCGHVVDDWQKPLQNKEAFTFSLGTDYANPFVTRSVTQLVVHPDWVPIPRYFNQPDLALLKLSEPIFDVAPAVRFRGQDPIQDGILNETRLYYGAGFGIHGILGEIPTTDSILRAGANLLERTNSMSFRFTNDNQSFHQPRVDLEWATSPGDSGSGLFQQVGENYELAGINATGSFFINTSQAAAVSTSGAVRITVFNDWIDSVISVPEPSALLLITTLLPIALWCAHRNKRIQPGNGACY